MKAKSWYSLIYIKSSFIQFKHIFIKKWKTRFAKTLSFGGNSEKRKPNLTCECHLNKKQRAGCWTSRQRAQINKGYCAVLNIDREKTCLRGGTCRKLSSVEYYPFLIIYFSEILVRNVFKEYGLYSWFLLVVQLKVIVGDDWSVYI